MGGGACLLLSLGLLGLLFGALYLPWTPARAGALFFWLIAPLAIYIGAGGLAGWHLDRILRPPHVEGSAHAVPAAE